MMARIRSLAETPAGSSPFTVMAIVLGLTCGSVWVASTCSTSLVPMPKASAPSAPWVEVWLSPHTIVRPGWVSPSCGPMTCTMPWLGVAHRVQPDAELGAVLAQRLDLGAGDRVGERAVGTVEREVSGMPGRRSRWWHVVVFGGDGQVGTAHLAAGLAQPVERLRAGHLVQQVQVDVEQIGLALRAAHHVGVPDLLGERTAHHALSLRLRLAFRDGSIHYMNNSSGVGVLDKTISVLSALESGPASLAQLVKATGLARPTAHRIAVALEATACWPATRRAGSCSARGSASWPPRPARTGCWPSRSPS